jgi:hypothetical protein
MRLGERRSLSTTCPSPTRRSHSQCPRTGLLRLGPRSLKIWSISLDALAPLVLACRSPELTGRFCPRLGRPAGHESSPVVLLHCLQPRPVSSFRCVREDLPARGLDAQRLSWEAQDREFLAALRERRPPAVGGVDVLPALAVLQEVQDRFMPPGTSEGAADQS